MRLVPSVLVAAATLATAAPALAHEVIYVGTLSGAKEVPPNLSPATGTAKLTINDHENTIRVEFSFANLMGGLTAAHIHGPTAVADSGTAGVMTTLPTFPGTPIGLKSGVFDQTFDYDLASSWNPSFLNGAPRNGDTSLAFATLITAIGDGKAYLNLHSTSVPGGEIRTFFQLAPVPEPETYALMLAGLGMLGWATRRKRMPI